MEEKYTLKLKGPYAEVYESETTYKKVYAGRLEKEDLDRIFNIMKDLDQKIPHLIPKTISIDRTPEGLIIVMEKMRGITMKEFLQKKHNLLETGKIIISLIDAVFAFHNAGYLHSDLHGDNIIIKEDLSIILLDFDLTDKYDVDEIDESGDYDYLKFYVSILIFELDTQKVSINSVEKITKKKKVEDVIGYYTHPEIAHSLFRIFQKLQI
jgi:predicted unusual protein kinase regulating ubiquinone biosynthesis (AarF/ABC1/UbiB family)